MAPALRAHFADYAAFHATPGNRACHYVGIPLIVLTLFSLLGAVPLFSTFGVTVSLDEVLLVLATLYYLTLDVTLGCVMFVAATLFLLLGRQIAPWPAAVLFVLGWALQFVGHYAYEKKSPAFLRNGTHLLVGPLWIVAKTTGRARA